MSDEQTTTIRITVTTAARRTGLSPRAIRRYICRGMVSERLTADDLARLRRIRRMTGLGINLAGVEVILRMRRRIRQLEAELDQLGRRGPAASREPPGYWKLIEFRSEAERDG